MWLPEWVAVHHDALSGQKRASNHRRAELLAVMSHLIWVLRTKHGSSVRVASVHNHKDHLSIPLIKNS